MLGKAIRVLLALMLGFIAGPAFGETVTVGAPAPDFDATSLDGKSVGLADFKGQVLVINLWATWCAPCKAELPMLEGYYRAQAKYGLRVVAVSTENSLPPKKLEPLAAHLTLSMVRDFHGPYQAINRTVPTNYVIDRAGVVRYAEPGAFTLDKLNALLVPLLQQQPGADAGTADKPAVPNPSSSAGH